MITRQQTFTPLDQSAYRQFGLGARKKLAQDILKLGYTDHTLYTNLLEFWNGYKNDKRKTWSIPDKIWESSVKRADKLRKKVEVDTNFITMVDKLSQVKKAIQRQQTASKVMQSIRKRQSQKGVPIEVYSTPEAFVAETAKIFTFDKEQQAFGRRLVRQRDPPSVNTLFKILQELFKYTTITDKFILFHGTPNDSYTRSIKRGIDFQKNKNAWYGKGFYLTPDIIKAFDYGNYILEFEVDPEKAKQLVYKKDFNISSDGKVLAFLTEKATESLTLRKLHAVRPTTRISSSQNQTLEQYATKLRRTKSAIDRKQVYIDAGINPARYRKSSPQRSSLKGSQNELSIADFFLKPTPQRLPSLRQASLTHKTQRLAPTGIVPFPSRPDSKSE